MEQETITPSIGKRTGMDFGKHELIITESDGLLIHYLKKPNTICDSIKYINTSGVMAVTGDYGNWIFCREFHPSDKGGVSEGYWIEKLKIASCQDPMDYSSETTTQRIKERLNELQEDGYDEDKANQLTEYYNDCLQNVDDYYEYIAAARNHPSFLDSESIIVGYEVKYWLRVVFDGFDEICRRMIIN